MSKRSSNHTSEEQLLAKHLHAEAVAAGTEKPGAGLCAVVLSNGRRGQTISRPATWEDYLADASARLSNGQNGGGH